jgi:hypothetical protein
MDICILCGEKLSKKRTNLEHLVPATSIRSFKTLCIPDSFTHAVRLDMRDEHDEEIVIAPRSAHKHWATIRVHEECNTRESLMCRDLAAAIKNLDDNPHRFAPSILTYYAKIWKMPIEDLVFDVISRSEAQSLYRNNPVAILYAPGRLWLGRIMIMNITQYKFQKDYQNYSIYLGSDKQIEKWLDTL